MLVICTIDLTKKKKTASPTDVTESIDSPCHDETNLLANDVATPNRLTATDDSQAVARIDVTNKNNVSKIAGRPKGTTKEQKRKKKLTKKQCTTYAAIAY